MPPKKQGWKNLTEKAAAGEYELVEPLDYLVLALLPEEGDLVMGYYPLTKNTHQLIKEEFSMLSPGEMSGVLRRLTIQGLATRVRTRGARDYGYQRTSTGKRIYEEWKQRQPKKSSDTSGEKTSKGGN